MPDGNAPFSGGSGPTWNDAMIAAGQIRRERSGYGAIAYSARTRRYGWSYGASDRGSAERLALAHCAAPDALVVCWGHHVHLAFAIGDSGGYGWAWANQARDAEQQAMDHCSRQTTNCRLVVTIDTNHHA